MDYLKRSDLDMEYGSTIVYKGVKAHYKVSSKDGKIFKAVLQHFDGSANQLPNSVTFFRDERSFLGDSDTIDLISELSGRMDEHINIDEIMKSTQKKGKE